MSFHGNHPSPRLNIRAATLCLAAMVAGLAPNARAGTPAHEDTYRAAMRALTEGRESDAREALNRLRTKTLDSPGAWLDLAILHCSLGDRDVAEQLFSEIEKKFSPPDAILEIIALQRATQCRTIAIGSQIRLQVSRGYESNANQGVRNPNFSIGSGTNKVDLTVLPDFLPAPDHYSGVYLDHRRSHTPNSNYESFIRFRGRDYDTLSHLNTNSFITGIEKSWITEDWPVKGTAAVGVTTLAGKPYVYQTQLQINTLIPNLAQSNWSMVAGGGVTHLHYPRFDSADGHIFESWTGFRSRSKIFDWQVNAGVMHDNPVRNRPGGHRNGLFGGFSIKSALSSKAEVEIAWQRQRWLSEKAQSPGLINQRRNQETEIFSAAASFPVTKNSFLIAEIQSIKNKENISIFEYRSRSIQLGWQYRI